MRARRERALGEKKNSKGGQLMRTSRVLAVAALAVAAGPVALAAFSAPAGAATTGSVKGAITSGGEPLAGVCVNVVNASDNNTVGTSSPSNAAGKWKLKNVKPSKKYTAYAVGCTESTQYYLGQWYNAQDFQSDATKFRVRAGHVTKKINFALSEGGGISGIVTDSSTGDPVQNVLVTALWTTQDSASAYSACTSDTGAYTLNGVPTSGAIVFYNPGGCGSSLPYDQAYYLNSTTYASATVVPVSAGEVTGSIDQALTPSDS
jgi:Carboxypeptidase regulatory-like domain